MRSPFKLGTFFALCITAAMASCGSDESSQPAGTCGNGTLEANEACDGAQIQPSVSSCALATNNAMPNGTVSCDGACNLVTSGCTNGVGGSGGGMNP